MFISSLNYMCGKPAWPKLVQRFIEHPFSPNFIFYSANSLRVKGSVFWHLAKKPQNGVSTEMTPDRHEWKMKGDKVKKMIITIKYKCGSRSKSRNIQERAKGRTKDTVTTVSHGHWMPGSIR